MKKMKRAHAVFVVIRHTRAGDQRIGVYDTSERAHVVAQGVVDAAVRDYGYGSASVFRGELQLIGRPMKPRKDPE